MVKVLPLSAHHVGSAGLVNVIVAILDAIVAECARVVDCAVPWLVVVHRRFHSAACHVRIFLLWRLREVILAGVRVASGVLFSLDARVCPQILQNVVLSKVHVHLAMVSLASVLVSQSAAIGTHDVLWANHQT